MLFLNKVAEAGIPFLITVTPSCGSIYNGMTKSLTLLFFLQ